MPNWFKERYPSRSTSSAIYRAIFPIDVEVQDTGDDEQNALSAYRLISDGLNRGRLFNYQLSLSDISKKAQSGLI